MFLLQVLAGSGLLLVGIMFLVVAVIEGDYLNQPAIVIGHAMLMGGILIIWKTFFTTPSIVYFMGSYLVLLVVMLFVGYVLHSKLANRFDR